MSCSDLFQPGFLVTDLPSRSPSTTVASLLVQGGAYIWGIYALNESFPLNDFIGDSCANLFYTSVGTAFFYRFYQKDHSSHAWKVALFDE